MLGELLGDGRTAKVYAWEDGEDKVVKLFHPTFDYFGVWEGTINEFISTFHLPVPTYFETIKTAGQTGVVFERVNGMRLSDHIMQHTEEIPTLLSKMAALQVQICSSKFADQDETLPVMKEVYRQRVIDNELLHRNEKKVLYNIIDLLPKGEVLCHADFHPENILVTDDQWYVIDWLTANRGCLEADVARTLVTIRYGLITYGVENGNLESSMEFMAFFDDYVAMVKNEANDFDDALFEQWWPVLLAGRLKENNSQAEHDAILGDLKEYFG